MTRTLLWSLAVALLLSVAVGGDAFGQSAKKGKSTLLPQFAINGNSLGSKAKAQQPGSLTGRQRTQKYYKMKLNNALVVPVSPLSSKHKGEIEIHSISPGASSSASKKRRLQTR